MQGQTPTPPAPAQSAPAQGTTPRRGRDANGPERLNPPQARETDSVLPAHATGEVNHLYEGNGPAPGNFWFRWAHGSVIAAKNRDPRVQTMQYNEDTYALRENICVHWRGPFTYLLFGNAGALLIDTGATPEPQWYPLRATTDALLTRWGGIRRKPAIPLTIAFTSGENRDQNAGLGQFAGRAHTAVAPRALPAMQAFYHLGDAASQTAGQIDLGGRVVDVIPTPGTHRDGVSFYDRYTQLLFTGDLLFPGKIAIANERDYIASLERLQAWKATHPVKWVLGGHVDMQFLPGKAYGRFATFKPYERELQLPPARIDDALAAAREIAGAHTVLARADFWLLHGVGPDERPTSFPHDLPNINGPRPA